MTKRLLISLLTLLCCCTGAWATGELNGLFTINASGDKVLFSKGNLQYVDENYQFAEHQYDYFGDNQYSNHVDMFAKNGYSSPDGDTAWRILSQSEWSYLYTERSVTNTLSEGARYSKATIGGTYKGVIVFPDSYTHPNGTGFAGNCNNAAENYASTVSLEGWALMEAAGCVFLPAAGYKNDNIRQVDDASVYDSSTANGDKSRCTPGFYSNEIKLDDKSYNTTCVPVRLVKDYQLQQDAEGNYLIGSADDWKDFAAIVNSGTNPAANAKMTADIDLGDDQTHIGDNNDVSYAYCGVFDGQGHKLNVNYYSSSPETTVEGGYSIAPFRNIKGATIKNLAVTGNITGYMHCAGVVGFAVSPSTNLINNVTVSANITILNTHGGGFIGHNEYATTTIQDCLFNGTINGKSGGSTVGVFFGWSGSATMSLINCLENGSYTNCSTFTPTSCPGYAVSTVTNCYYAVSGSYPGTHATSAQLADGTTSTALQNGRAEEIWVQDPITNQPMLKLFATKAYTVPASGIGTFSAKANFTVPDGLTAHYCKTYDKKNGTIGVVDIDGAVPANTGVLLKGTPGETYTLTGTNNEAATVTGNALVAVTEATHVAPTDGEYTNFMLKSGTFIRIAASDDDVKMPANKAYLQIQTSDLPVDSQSGTRGIRLSWGGVTSIHNSQLIIHNYALPAKRIVRGKLIIEKNGQMFNANGQLIK